MGVRPEGKPKAKEVECTCDPKQINHYVVAVSDCKKHQNAEYFKARRDAGSVEFYSQANKIQGQMLYKRQQLLEKAEELVKGVHDRAAAEGRKATFADVRKAAGIPDFTQGESRVKAPYGRMDREAFKAALAGIRNERNAERAMIDPPPEFDPNTFDPWRQAQRIDQLMSETPDDQEHAIEFGILTETRHWLDQNRECGRKEYELAERRIRAAAIPPDELGVD